MCKGLEAFGNGCVLQSSSFCTCRSPPRPAHPRDMELLCPQPHHAAQWTLVSRGTGSWGLQVGEGLNPEGQEEPHS